MDDETNFKIGDTIIGSRLLMGTAGYPNRKSLLAALEAGGAEIVTLSVRRISLDGYEESLVDALGGRFRLLPNTAGCSTVRDAVLTAELAREALQTDWIKLELIGDRETLYPDVPQLLEAAAILVGKGFIVLPYTNDDPVTARKLADLGCAAVMPLGALIGSGMGIQNLQAIERICARAEIPVILDAGIGTASDAARAMELGCSAVLVNTAIAKAEAPALMASAMCQAVTAGFLARQAGRIPMRDFAEPSSPQFGLIGSLSRTDMDAAGILPVVVILAGGNATRFGGGDKTLSDLAGEPLLARIIDRLRAQGSALVLSANGDPARFARFGLPVVTDASPARLGPLAGMLAALDWVRRLRPDATDIVTVPADAPFLPFDLVSRLSRARQDAGTDLAWATSNGRAHPVVALIPVRLAEDLRQAIEGEALRKVDAWMRRYPVTDVPFACAPVDPFFNINSRADLAEAEAIMRRLARSSDGTQ